MKPVDNINNRGQLLINEEENHEDSDDSSSFHSVASSLQSSILTAEEGVDWVYLRGNFPTQTDRQVYDVIRFLDHLVMDQQQYPSLNSWKILMETFGDEERRQWPSYEKQIKSLTSDLLVQTMQQQCSSSSVNAKSKLFSEYDSEVDTSACRSNTAEIVSIM